MTIINAVPATSRDGREQWELTVRWEWTPTANRYGQRIWVFKEETPADVTRLGAFTVQVERGRLVAKSEASGGGFHEGSMDWQWHWKILAWDGAGVSAPAPDPALVSGGWGQVPAPRPEATPQPPQAQPQAPVIQRAPAGSIDEKQMMIMRQSTLNYASILMAPVVKDYNSEDLIRVTTQMASKLLEYVITGEIPRVEDPDAEVEF
jgi:hypothetical protein